MKIIFKLLLLCVFSLPIKTWSAAQGKVKRAKRSVIKEAEMPVGMSVVAAEPNRRTALVMYYFKDSKKNVVCKKTIEQLTPEELRETKQLWRARELRLKKERTFEENLELSWIRERRKALDAGTVLPLFSLSMLYTNEFTG